MIDSDRQLVQRHYGADDLLRRIFLALKEVGKDPDKLDADDLAAVDGFHTRGRQATAELAQMGKVSASDQILDVGCSLGGSLRYLAKNFGCRGVGVDLSQDYIFAGQELNRRLGLAPQIDLHQGDALALPMADNIFDTVWTEHVQMNIADKDAFYRELTRVLRPGGRLLFHDVFRRDGPEPVYPVPWADNPAISFLAKPTVARASLENAGLETECWVDKSQESLAFFANSARRLADGGYPPLGLHLLMGKNSLLKLQNLLANLRSGSVSVIMGMARKD